MDKLLADYLLLNDIRREQRKYLVWAHPPYGFLFFLAGRPVEQHMAPVVSLVRSDVLEAASCGCITCHGIFMVLLSVNELKNSCQQPLAMPDFFYSGTRIAVYASKNVHSQ